MLAFANRYFERLGRLNWEFLAEPEKVSTEFQVGFLVLLTVLGLLFWLMGYRAGKIVLALTGLVGGLLAGPHVAHQMGVNVPVVTIISAIVGLVIGLFLHRLWIMLFAGAIGLGVGVGLYACLALTPESRTEIWSDINEKWQFEDASTPVPDDKPGLTRTVEDGKEAKKQSREHSRNQAFSTDGRGVRRHHLVLGFRKRIEKIGQRIQDLSGDELGRQRWGLITAGIGGAVVGIAVGIICFRLLAIILTSLVGVNLLAAAGMVGSCWYRAEWAQGALQRPGLLAAILAGMWAFGIFFQYLTRRRKKIILDEE